MDHTLSRRELRARHDRQGFILLGVSAVAVLGIGIVVMIAQPPARDHLTGCLSASKPATQTVPVVDRTEKWSPANTSLLHEALLSLAAGIQPEDRLTILTLDGRAEASPQPLFDKCRPYRGAEVNAALVTPAKADKTYNTSFGEPLAKVLTGITVPTKAPESNIVAYLANTAATLTYQANAGSIVMPVYSDLAENTTTHSFVSDKKKSFDPTSFTQHFKSIAGDKFRAVALQIVVVPTPSTPPAVARRIKQAWTTALDAAGVRYTWRAL